MKKLIIFLLILGVGFSIYFNVIEENDLPSGNYDNYYEDSYGNSSNNYDDSYNGSSDDSYDNSYNNNQSQESFRDKVQSGHDLFNSMIKDKNTSSSQQSNTNTNTNTKPNTNTTKPNINTNTNTQKPGTSTNTNTNNSYDLSIIFNPYNGKVSGTSNDIVKMRVSKNKDNIINSVSRSDEVLKLAAQAISAFKNENSSTFRNLVTEHTRRDSYNLSGYAEKFKYCNAIEYTVLDEDLIKSANKGMKILYGDGYVVTDAVNMTFDITNESSHNRKYWFITFYKMNGKWGLQSWGDAI